MTTLPRITSRVQFVDFVSGTLTPDASNYLESLVIAIEKALDSIETQDAAIAATQADQAEQLQMIQNALGQIEAVGTVANTGSASGAPSGRLTGYGSLNVTSTSWVTVATVQFSAAVAASSVGLAATGPTSGSAAYATHPTTQNGSVRVLRNGSSIAGPVSYSVDGDGNLTFGGFSAPSADATTGTVTYDLQVEKTSGSSADLAFILDVTRTP